MRTINEIYEALVQDLVTAGGVVPVEGGDLALRLRAVAAEIFTLEGQADFVTRQSFPQTAVGEYLDRHAALRGLSRGSAQNARGTLRFYLDAAVDGAIAIPAGSECITAAGASFVTTEAAEIPEGSLYCDAAAEATRAGSAGNVPAGSGTYLRNAPAVVRGVTNPAPFAGGTEVESDSALRVRILGSYRSLPNGANAAYYQRRVQEQGAVAVTV
ncbi:MAG: baseplate J/gp47 family protein, partial [Oscillospiraceae bacterium]|nr:baseplate J/gp47 family protein [Oscillospiraceae bacterium]